MFGLTFSIAERLGPCGATFERPLKLGRCTMTIPAIDRIFRMSFFTDMTRADAPVIPLGCMLEAAWPDQARWLGLIGRTPAFYPPYDPATTYRLMETNAALSNRPLGDRSV